MDINKYILSKDWKSLALSYSVEQICSGVTFEEGVNIAYHMLYNDDWDEKLQQHAVKILEFLKEMHPKDWLQSWKNEAFLGIAYDVTLDYDKRYEALRNACALVDDAPPELLIKLSGCIVAPGELRISLEEAQSLLERSMEIAVYKDAIQLLSHIFWLRGDLAKSNYWKDYDKREKKVSELSPEIVPDSINRSMFG